MDNIILIAAIAVLLVISPFIANITRSPLPVVEIILGIIVMQTGLIHHSETLEVFGEIGFLYLMFLAGTEVDIKKIISLGKIELKKAILYISILYVLSISATLYFDLSPTYAVALPVLSIGMIMPIMKEFGKNDSWLQKALIIGVLGELASIIAFVVINGYLTSGIGIEFYKTMGTLILFLVLSVLFFKIIKIIFWWFPELKLKIMPVIDRKDQDMRFSITIFFIMIAMMLHLNLELVLGTFLAGMFISTFFEHKRDLPDKLSAVGFGFLIPIFFIHVGTTLNLEAMMSQEVMLKILYITLFMFMMRLIAAFTVYYRELKFKNTLLFALSHSMPLTFLIAIASIGYQTSSISTNDYYAFVASAAIEALVFLMVIKIIKVYKKDSSKMKKRESASSF
ncbi:MAG: cation:proton antiporter [Campylobacterales bacterium]